MNTDTTPIEIGSELTPRVQKVTRAHLSDFRDGFGGSTAHADPSARPLQYGARTMYPFYAMLSERFPRAFARGGKVEGKFLAAVTLDDVITCHCRAAERREVDGQQMLMFETWAVNQNGEKVLVGKASVNEGAQ